MQTEKTKKQWLNTGLVICLVTMILSCGDSSPSAAQSPWGAVKNSSADSSTGSIAFPFSQNSAQDMVYQRTSSKTQLVEITGMVSLIDGAIVVATPEWDYFVVGKDLTDMVGRRVHITGTLEENEDRSTITVISVTPVD